MGLKRTSAAVEVNIEELRLTGFPAGEGRRLRRAVEQELARLIAAAPAAGLPGQAAEVDHVDAGRLRFAPGASPHTVGAQIARAVFSGLREPAAKGGRR
jgi:L-2-hydroxyglutarate oxidase LhgO